MAQPKGTAKDKREEPLLELSTLAPTIGSVLIDGVRYPLVNLDALGLRARDEIVTLSQRVFELVTKGAKIKAFEEREYDEKVVKVAGLILPTMPPSVRNKLLPGQCGDIVGTFFTKRAEEAPQRLAIAKRIEALPQLQQTGDKSSPDSNSSTAVRRRRGSTKSRRRSSSPT